MGITGILNSKGSQEISMCEGVQHMEIPQRPRRILIRDAPGGIREERPLETKAVEVQLGVKGQVPS